MGLSPGLFNWRVLLVALSADLGRAPVLPPATAPLPSPLFRKLLSLPDIGLRAGPTFYSILSTGPCHTTSEAIQYGSQGSVRVLGTPSLLEFKINFILRNQCHEETDWVGQRKAVFRATIKPHDPTAGLSRLTMTRERQFEYR